MTRMAPANPVLQKAMDEQRRLHPPQDDWRRHEHAAADAARIARAEREIQSEAGPSMVWFDEEPPTLTQRDWDDLYKRFWLIPRRLVRALAGVGSSD